MGCLTAFGIYQRLEGLRPSPSRLECGPSHRSPANIDEFQFSLIKRPHLIRPIKAFSFHRFHAHHLLTLVIYFALSIERWLLEIQLSSKVLPYRQIESPKISGR
jgi:hypothetical protein